MKRIYEPRAYGTEPLAHGYWHKTIQPQDYPRLDGDRKTDVAIVGGGFTGLNAALHLAENGTQVTVLDAETPGWGASGRNGGFCCLGGGILEDAAIDKIYGHEERQIWHDAEAAAITHVAGLLKRHEINADTHSKGETLLAHKAARLKTVLDHTEKAAKSYGVSPEIIDQKDLADHGMAGPFHGAVTIPLGFGLNPAKYAQGVAKAATNAGATLYAKTPVTRVERGTKFKLHTPHGTVTADQILIATNGYSAEDIPDWMSAKFMPVQSSVLVTRPLTEAEIDAAGWSTDQMAYDSRNLLHYFRLMPNRQFLFGMRGGIFATPRKDRKIMALVRKHFEDMFPAWAHVETPYAWSGLVCMTRKGLPFAGPVPDMTGAFASFGYHGNGVAMASYCGTQTAKAMLGEQDALPWVLRRPPPTIPLGTKRRWLLPPLYALMGLSDR